MKIIYHKITIKSEYNKEFEIFIYFKLEMNNILSSLEKLEIFGSKTFIQNNGKIKRYIN